jgi:branched-chain amino acid transport system substrate-binding protein
VGFLCSCSGEGGFLASNVADEDAYKAWANTVNAAGGINGHPVQVLTEDDTANPGTALSNAQTLLSRGVVAMVDNSVVDQTFETALQSANVPVVGVLTNGAPFVTNPDFYGEGQTNDSILYSLVAIAKEAGAKNIVNMYCAEASQCAQITPLIQAAGKQLGVHDVYNAAISATAPNYTAQCLAAKQAGVTSLFLADVAAVNMHFASDCAQQGYNPIYVIEAAGSGTNVFTAPGFKNSLWIQSANVPFFSNVPAVQTMNAAMDKYYPGVRENPNLWFENGLATWASGKLLQDAIMAGGLTAGDTPSAAEVVKGLTSLKGDTLGGLAPPLSFTAGAPHHIDCWFAARVQNGAASVVNNGQVACENGSSS